MSDERNGHFKLFCDIGALSDERLHPLHAGVERSNDPVASYHRPDHPAVLRGIHRVVTAAAAAGKRISVCGEMAHDVRFIPFFIGIGIRELNVDPQFLPVVQRTVADLSLTDAVDRAGRLLAETTLDGVQRSVSDLPKPQRSPPRVRAAVIYDCAC